MSFIQVEMEQRRPPGPELVVGLRLERPQLAAMDRLHQALRVDRAVPPHLVAGMVEVAEIAVLLHQMELLPAVPVAEVD